MLHAFDPGLSLGWAFVDADRPRSRLIDLWASSEGAVYMRARARLLEILNGGDVVAVEAAIMPNKVTIRSRLVLFGIRAMIVAVAHERMARVVEVEPHRWRKHFIGVVSAPAGVPRKKRRQWLKDRARWHAQQRGWGVVSEDEADALGILDYLRCTLDANYGALSTELMRA